MKCKRCGASFADDAESCPNCGISTERKSKGQGQRSVKVKKKSSSDHLGPLVYVPFMLVLTIFFIFVGAYSGHLRAFLLINFIVVIFFIFGLFIKYDPNRQKPLKYPIKTITKNVMRVPGGIRKVDVVPYKLGFSVSVYIKPAYIYDENTYFLIVGHAMLNAAQMLVTKHSRDVEQIVYFLIGPVVDKYGNESTDLLITLIFPMNELIKINWKNMPYEKFLNFATEGTFSPVGEKLLIAHCRKNGDPSQEFCLRFLTKLETQNVSSDTDFEIE